MSHRERKAQEHKINHNMIIYNDMMLIVLAKKKTFKCLSVSQGVIFRKTFTDAKHSLIVIMLNKYSLLNENNDHDTESCFNE